MYDTTKKNVIKGYNFDQYRKKYGKKFDKGKLEFVSFNDIDKLKDKKKYWEIIDGKQPGYYEVSKKKFLIPLFICLGTAIAATAIAVPLALLVKCGGNENGHEAEVVIEGDDCDYEIEGGESLTGHKAGDVIVIDFSVDWGFNLPETVDVENAASYEYDKDTGKLTIVFGDKDISITVSPVQQAETVTDPEEDGVIEVTYPNNEVKTFSINGFRQEIINKIEMSNTYWFSMEGCNAKLLKNVELNDFIPFSSKGSGNNDGLFYSGSFDGNNKIFKITDDDFRDTELGGWRLGLFADVYGLDTAPTTFKDLKLDLNIESEEYRPYIGGLIGRAWGSMNISNIEVDGEIKGSRTMGGIIGDAETVNGDVDYDDVINISDCVVNANITSTSCTANDDYGLIGGIVGQTNVGDYAGGEFYDTAGLYIDNCSVNGVLTVDLSGVTPDHYALMGYAVAKGTETSHDRTVISNFHVLDNAKIIAHSNIAGTYDYPFEGFNTFDSSYTYEGTANYYKELFGGYFERVIVDGQLNPGEVYQKSGHNLFAHGSN